MRYLTLYTVWTAVEGGRAAVQTHPKYFNQSFKSVLTTSFSARNRNVGINLEFSLLAAACSSVCRDVPTYVRTYVRTSQKFKETHEYQSVYLRIYF